MTTTPIRSEHRSTFDESNTPALLPIALRLADMLHRMKLLPVNFDRDSLTSAALKAANAAKFDAPINWEGFEILGKSIQHNENATFMTRSVLRGEVIRQLRIALQLEEFTRANPTVVNEVIKRPIIITGLPRTGTTLLHRLLARDPKLRVPKFWELTDPMPIHETGSRVRSGQRSVNQITGAIPKYLTIHPLAADEPEECVFLLMHRYEYVARGVGSEYMEWLGRYDHRLEYQRYRRLLQVLQFGQPSSPAPQRWVLKSPFHLFTLDAIAEVFPDAQIIFTHRSPAEAIPSWASLMATVQKPIAREVDLTLVGRQWADLWQKGVERAQAVRDKNTSLTFTDVHYGDLVSNPIDTVKEIYEKIQQPWTNEADAQMRDWLRDNARGKFQEHRYSLEQFGLNKTQIDQQYAGYIKRYKLED